MKTIPRRSKASFFRDGRRPLLETKEAKGDGKGKDDKEEKIDATHLLEEVKTLIGQQDAALEKWAAEVKANGKATDETKKAVEDIQPLVTKMAAQILALSQKISDRPNGQASADAYKSIGEQFTDTESFKQMKGRNFHGSANMQLSRDEFNLKTTITIGGLPQPTSGILTPQRVPGIIMPQLRQLRVRDLLPQARTNTNAIDFVKELLFTSAAAPVAEGAAKPEGALTFAISNVPVRTIAHVMTATRQVLDDFVQLQGYIDNRMTYGLKLVEEAQLLSGDGTGQNILGLIPQATAYDTNRTQTGDTKIDILRHAIAQARIAEFPVDGIVLNPGDWELIETVKNAVGDYVIGDPKGILPFTIWGRAVVETTAITAGTFLTGGFQLGAQIFDRMDVEVAVSTEHQDYFAKNLVMIRVEERLALAVFRPAAFVTGSY